MGANLIWYLTWMYKFDVWFLPWLRWFHVFKPWTIFIWFHWACFVMLQWTVIWRSNTTVRSPAYSVVVWWSNTLLRRWRVTIPALALCTQKKRTVIRGSLLSKRKIKNKRYFRVLLVCVKSRQRCAPVIWFYEIFWLLFILHCAGWWGSFVTGWKRSRENDCRGLCSPSSSFPFNWKVCAPNLYCQCAIDNCFPFFVYIVPCKKKGTNVREYFLSRVSPFASGSMSIRGAIAECLPDHKLAILVPVLERFVVCLYLL